MSVAADAGRLPVGTVTFLRTDVEGSMRRLRRLGSAWDDVNATHLAIVRGAVEGHGGVVVRTEGDACFAAFAEARAAAAAAVAIQREIAAADLGDPDGLAIRVGLHTGEAHLAGDDYGGFEVNRAARIAAAGHGGQIVISDVTRSLIEDGLPTGSTLLDLGTHTLRDVPRPERLSQLSVEGLPTSFPPLRTGGPVAGNLPERMTSFVGREDELAAAVDMTRDARLITLTGPGGIGKSSLAIEVARVIASRFDDGAWFVSLADVADPADLAGAIAYALGLLDGPERRAGDALVPYLADRAVVLVLDNLEHLLAGTDTVAAIVRGSPASRVITTSRAPLHVAGEREVPVPPLTNHAVQLYIERVRAVRPNWDPGDDAPIREICAMLDHLPLGIELAAARAAHLPPSAIRDRLAARLPLPGPGPRDAPARQRTLESAVAWSHDLLTEDRQALLHSLAVFDGGFDLDQVIAVAGPGSVGSDRLDDLLDLADQSLIVPMPEVSGRVRFRQLRTIQSFALERLMVSGREPATRRRHAEAFLELALEAQPHLNTSRHVEWIERLAPEQANLRVAVRWTIDSGSGELALRLTASLWRLWHAFGQVADGRALAERVLAMPDAPADGADRAWAEAAAGSLAYWQADSAAARRHYEAQVALATGAQDEAAVADGYFNMGHVLFIEHADEAQQRDYVDQVVARFRDLGDERGMARAMWSFAVIDMGRGRVDEAYGRLLACQAEFDRIDDRQYHAMTVGSLGWAAFVAGDVQTASRRVVDSIVETMGMRDLGTTTISLHVGMLLASIVGRDEDAVLVSGAFDGLCERYGVRPPAALQEFVGDLDPLARARAEMTPAAYAAAYEQGRRMTLEEAVALIVELGDSAATSDPASQE